MILADATSAILAWYRQGAGESVSRPGVYAWRSLL